MIYFTGANGQVGFELSRVFSGKNTKPISRADWDLSVSGDIQRSLAKEKFSSDDVFIHSGAYTAVDLAEKESEIAKQVNETSTRDLVELAKKHDFFLIYLSTDFIFGEYEFEKQKLEKNQIRFWRETDKPSPTGAYAETKLLGEQLVSDAISKNFIRGKIIRTSWVYSSHGKNFPKTILNLLKDEKRNELKVIEDQIGRPTWAKRIAIVISEIVEQLERTHSKRNSGSAETSEPSEKAWKDFFVNQTILQISNSGIASWYDFAIAIQEIAISLGILQNQKPILPIPTEQYPTPAKRPHFSAMDLEKSRMLFHLPHWREDLETCLKEMI